MTQTTQTKTKAKVAKPRVKLSQASQALPVATATTYAYALILTDALTGTFGSLVQRFYASAITHHTKLGTSFPRPAYASVPLLSVDEARAKLDAHRATSIPNANTWSRRLFDQMMVEAKAKATSK